MGYILIFPILFAFIILVIYGMFNSKSTLKRLRKVDVRVLDCTQLQLAPHMTEQEATFYNVTVEFIGLQGETLTRTIQSVKSYVKDDVIRCAYDAKKDVLYTDTSQLEQSFKNGFIIIGALLLILLFVLFGLMASLSPSGQAPDWAKYILGYATGILFAGIGIRGILRMRAFSAKKSMMRAVEGTLMDYRKEWSHGKARTIIYYPIYEYYDGAESKRQHSKFGSSGKKSHEIGRKVTILIDPGTDVVYCEEEEKSRIKLTVLFFVLGIAVIGLMAASNLGWITLN